MTSRRHAALFLFGLLAAGCKDPPAPERLPVPETADPVLAPWQVPPPPPPPPPPPAPHPLEPPAEVRELLAAHAGSTHPWRVTFIDLATRKRADLSAADAEKLVALLARREAWMTGEYGCASHGMDIRISRGRGPSFAMWTSCGNVHLDRSTAALAEPAIDWLRDRASALGLTPP